MIPYYQIDAFTNMPFHGNQAGVALLEKDLSETLMRNIALQNNLPATAFVVVRKDYFSMRWFTPVRELPLCGHATLASAYILFKKGYQKDTIVFITKSGNLTARLKHNWIELDLPAYDYKLAPLPAELQQAFGSSVVGCFSTQNRYLIELEKERDVRDFKPNMEMLKSYRVILTAQAEASATHDFVSRYFAWPDGVSEDAVTGSSHCSLTSFWYDRLHKKTLHAYQVSERGGELKLERTENGVTIAGQAVIFMEGNILF